MVMQGSISEEAGGVRVASSAPRSATASATPMERFERDVGDGLVPKERYTSPEFARLEMEGLWRHVWQMACHVDDIPRPGDYFEYLVGDESILILRDDAGTIRAFFNVCMHRGTQLGKGCGNVEEIVCPYHGWTYGLDGRLRRMPAGWDFPDCSATSHGLRECRVDTWAGLVFINMDPDSESLMEFLDPISGHLAPYHFENFVCVKEATALIAANWKTVVDNMSESYHFAASHSHLLPVIAYEDTQYDIFDRHSRIIVPQWGPSSDLPEVDEDTKFRRYFEAVGAPPPERPEGMTLRDFLLAMNHARAQAAGRDVSGLTERQMLEVVQYMFNPNFMIGIMPGGSDANVLRARPYGSDPNLCLFDFTVYEALGPRMTRPPKAPNEFFDLGATGFDVFRGGVTSAVTGGILMTEEGIGLVYEQDNRNLPKVQKGMQSGAYPGLTLGKYQERPIRHRHQFIDQYIERYAGR